MSNVQAHALSLFDDLVDLDETARQRRLDQIKSDDLALYEEISALLRADSKKSPLLDTSPLNLFAETFADSFDVSEPSEVGAIFGAWLAVAVLGRGGMGVVYKVERSDGKHHQTAALKHIRTEMSSPKLVASFLRERDYLARLSHPGIVPLIDSGVDEQGRPWFVMREVAGTPIDAWCDQHRLSIRKRVALFLEACDAIAYAHESGVLHQDIKPSNLLVTSDGRTQLLDFGLAAMIHGEPTAYRRIAATAHYTASEVLQGAYPGAQADVYALGVLLYLLLCGTLPHAPTDHPPLPNSTAHHAVPTPSQMARQASSTLAEERGCQTPRMLSRQLIGDLDAIALASVSPDPAKRYGTVGRLQHDLRQWLAFRPVTVRNDTWSYRTGRFLRRNRLTSTVVASTGLILGVTLSLVGYQQYRSHEEMVANSQVDRFFEQMLAVATMSTLGDKPMTTNELLQKTEDQLRTQTASDPTVLARGLAVLARNWALAGNYARAEILAKEACARAGNDSLQRGFDQAILAQIQNQEAHYPDAELSARQGLTNLGFGWTQQHTLARVRLEAQLAESQSGQGLSPMAFRTMNTALGEASSLTPTMGNQAIADLLVKRGTWWRLRVRMRESESDLTRAIALAGQSDPVVADDARQSLIRTIRGSRRPNREVRALELAEQLLASRQHSLGPLHPQTGTAWAELAYIQMLNRKNADASASIDKAESILKLSLDAHHPALARVYVVRANLDTLEGKQDAGMALTRQALDIYRERFGPTHEFTLETRFLLASEYWTKSSVYGDKDAQNTALKMIGDAIADSVAAHGEVAAIHRIAYATLLASAGHKQQAADQLAQAKIDAAQQYGPHSQEMLHIRLAEASLLIDSGADPSRTETALNSLVEDSHRESGLYAQSIEYTALMERSRWLQAQGRMADARASLVLATDVTAKANEPQWRDNVANKIKQLDDLAAQHDIKKK